MTTPRTDKPTPLDGMSPEDIAISLTAIVEEGLRRLRDPEPTNAPACRQCGARVVCVTCQPSKFTPPPPDPTASPTVRRSLGEEVGDGRWLFPTIEVVDLALSLEYTDAPASEWDLAESMVKLRDVAMDAHLLSETVTDYLSDHPGLCDDPHTRSFERSERVHESLAEIIRLSGEAIGPYIREAVKDGPG